MIDALTPEDEREIHQLVASYNWATDSSDPEEFSSLFTDDGEFHSARFDLHGRSELEGFVRTENLAARGLQHWTANLLLSFEGPGRARARCYMLVVAPQADGSLIVERNGRYQDLLVKVDGRWKFRERVFTKN